MHLTKSAQWGFVLFLGLWSIVTPTHAGNPLFFNEGPESLQYGQTIALFMWLKPGRLER